MRMLSGVLAWVLQPGGGDSQEVAAALLDGIRRGQRHFDHVVGTDPRVRRINVPLRLSSFAPLGSAFALRDSARNLVGPRFRITQSLLLLRRALLVHI